MTPMSTQHPATNKLPGVHMCTSQVALMDMDGGILARIDRKLLAGLCGDEALRTLRVPATAAKWSTWKRYCDSAGISMGRTVAMLIDRELENREAEIEARERKVDTDEARMRERSERLQRWEDELEGREYRVEAASKRLPSASTARTKSWR